MRTSLGIPVGGVTREQYHYYVYTLGQGSRKDRQMFVLGRTDSEIIRQIQ